MHRYVVSRLAIVLFLCSVSPSSLFAEDAPKEKAAPNGAAEGKPGSGTLLIGKKTYKLEHVVAYQSKVFDDDMINVIMSDRAIPVDKLKAVLRDGKGTDDGFSLFQPHVKVTFNKEGKPSFCNAYADNSSLSVSGGGLKGELAVKEGRVAGNVVLEAAKDEERKSSFDLRFDVALLVVPVPPAEKKAADSEKPKAGKKEKKKAGKAADDAKAVKTDETLNVHDLPLPRDAANVKYKDIVEQMGYTSALDVKTLAAFLSKELAKQGWETPDDDLVTPKSAILKRERGEASLTIFVKPDQAGSKVTIMSSGLSWEEKPAETDPDKAPADEPAKTKSPPPKASKVPPKTR